MMRILFCNRPGGAFGYITDGMINAFRDKDHIVQRWDGLGDSWFKFAPDIYFGCSGHKQPIPTQRNCKVIIHVNPYGPIPIKGINELEENIQWTLTQRPDAVFGYGQENDNPLWSYWTQRHGVQWIPMPTAGDSTIFKRLTPDNQKEYDLVYLGGRWAYKGLTINTYLIPLLNNNIKYKLHGWGDWPAGLCSGELADDKAAQFLNSGRLGPCISEKHTHTHGIDIPERAFKVALCGTLVVHDPAFSIKNLMPSALVASNADQFHEYCKYFSRPENSAERIDLANKQYCEVIGSNTYHHRLSNLLMKLNFIEESKYMLS